MSHRSLLILKTYLILLKNNTIHSQFICHQKNPKNFWKRFAQSRDQYPFKTTKVGSTCKVSSIVISFETLSHFVKEQHHFVFLLAQKYLATLCLNHST